MGINVMSHLKDCEQQVAGNPGWFSTKTGYMLTIYFVV